MKLWMRAAVSIKGDCQALAAPENRAKYRAQVQVRYGIYLDAYWNPADSEWSRWRIDCGERKPVEHLLLNVRSAVQCCDEYVWIYGEEFRWWPTPNKGVFEQSWPEALPNCDLALRLARDPVACAEYIIADNRRDGTLENLARNGTFDAATALTNDGKQADWVEDGAPAGWNAWQVTAGQGTFLWDRGQGAAKASGIAESGCFIQGYDVQPGESYSVRTRVLAQGHSSAWVRLRWQTPEATWTKEILDVIAAPEDPEDDGWRPIFTSAVVPEGLGKLILLLGVGNQLEPADVAWFDDVAAFRLSATATFTRDPVRWDQAK